MSEIVYRNFDQATLDRQYDARAHVGRVEHYFQEYNERSLQVRERLICSCDIPYGSSEGETLDIFFQSKRHYPPIHIFFHGGGYRSQDKFNFSFVAEPLVNEGAIVVIPNYGLCPVFSMDEIIQQTRNSIAWVHRNARIMGGNPNAITISGHSAGAHIVSRALEACWSDFDRTPDDVIKGAMSISGIYDQEARRLSYLNEFLRLDEEQSLRNSSFFYTPRRRVPYVLAVGDGETDEYIRQTKDYAEALRGRSYDVTFMLVNGYNHYNVLTPFTDFSHSMGSALYSLVFNNRK